jgi:hypothetical protein
MTTSRQATAGGRCLSHGETFACMQHSRSVHIADVLALLHAIQALGGEVTGQQLAGRSALLSQQNICQLAWIADGEIKFYNGCCLRSTQLTARASACRKAIFLKEIGSWMSDPKLPPSVRERWFDIWGKVDSGLATTVCFRPS